jgi:hypothetical protein
MPRIPTPLRLTIEDFDAFLPHPAEASPASRDRGRTRLDMATRMLRWARAVVRRLEDQGIEARAVAPGFGTGPRKGKGAVAQRVWIQEPPSTSSDPAESGARLVLSLDGAGVAVALEIPASASAAVASLCDALGDEERRAELLAAAEMLPEQFTVGLEGETGAAASDPSAWNAVVERSAATGRPLRIGWNVPRDVAVAHTSVLDEQLEDGIVLLAPIYKLIVHAESDPRRGRSKGKTGLLSRRPKLAVSQRRSGPPVAIPSLERGARVRVLAGPFAGKVGVVKDVDGRGRAQVMLGLLATRIDVRDLSTSNAGRRPTLGSSHRKPLGLR